MFGDQTAGGLWGLHAGPRFALSARNPCSGGGRLHRGVSDVRQVILRYDVLRALGHRTERVAVVSDRLCWLARGFLELLAVCGRVIDLVRAVIPFNLERAAPLIGGPGVLRDHGNAAQRVKQEWQRTALDLDDLDDSRNLQGSAGIEGTCLASRDRRASDDRVQHVGKARIDAISGAAFGDVGAVDQLDITPADVAEVLGILELQGGGGW